MVRFFGAVGLLAAAVSCVSADSSAFPHDFAWGAATAAYQVEGAYKEGGRGLSIWDTFSHTPGKTANGDTGDIADDSYHRYEEDIKLAKAMGITHYRFSMAWSRLLPTGDFPVNPDGIAFYNKVIDTLVANGIEPFVTLYHWDLPQALEDEYLGWLDEKSITSFARYAEVVFLNFGDRVKYWLTFNEPLTFVGLGYAYGIHAPGRCSDRSKCTAGDGATEPYIVAHNVLRAHARAVSVYRELKQATTSILDGKIGITLNCDWAEPLTSSEQDKEAAERLLQFNLAWFADPVFFGKYPDVMVQNVGDRLPSFTKEEAAELKGSYDFFGLNHYTSKYASQPNYPIQHGSYDGDAWVSTSTTDSGGKLIGAKADSDWLYVVPWGFRKLLNWVAERYGNPGIYVTENGCDVPDESSIPLPKVLEDDFRVNFYKEYIGNMSLAIQDGVDVRGYMAWSLLDNFEWADGYSKRFGMHYVDYNDGLKRYAKKSSKWYHDFIKSTKTSAPHTQDRLRSSNTYTTTDKSMAPAQAIPQAPSVRASVLAGLLGFTVALVLVAGVLVGRSYVRRSRHESVDIERGQSMQGFGAGQRPAHGDGEEDDDDDDEGSVHTDLLSPRTPYHSEVNMAAMDRPSSAMSSASRRSGSLRGSQSMGQLTINTQAEVDRSSSPFGLALHSARSLGSRSYGHFDSVEGHGREDNDGL